MTDTNLDTKHGRVTTDHRTIRQWAEERGGNPAVEAKAERGITIPRIQFSDDEDGDSTIDGTSISWHEWFEAFESGDFAFAYQERTSNDETLDGDEGRFYKLVDRTASREHA
ncbi:hypothetical protein [Haladaptatus sp. DFWS20]|uniref:hypothetical protein n=1 Tax=Haladaptatus sp. DFWS20 TaxID=3403467 RepID=UPI003EBD34BF